MRITEKRPLQVGLVVMTTLSLFSFIIFTIYERNKRNTFYELLQERTQLRALQVAESLQLDYSMPSFLPLRTEQFAIYNLEGSAIYVLKDEPNELPENILKVVLQEGKLLQETDSTQYIFQYIESPSTPLIIYEAAVDKLGNARLDFLKKLLILGTIICTLTTYLLIRFIVNQEMQPFLSIIRKMHRITSENLTEKLVEAEVDNEVGQMAKTFNKLTERLHKSINHQKSFISSVSHELRNPLAIVQGMAEVALLKDRKPEDYQKSLSTIKESVAEMTALVNNLLLLSKTQSNPEDIIYSPSRIDEVIWEAKDQLIRKNPQCRVNVHFQLYSDDEETLIVPRVNEKLLKVAFFNLMENSCKYSTDHRVEITITSNPNTVDIQFADNGIGIPRDEIQSVLIPFQRSANAIKTEGFGLGLPLVKQITDVHGAEIIIESELNSGTTITLIFSKTIEKKLQK
ncbi:HAMP domain-containing sensor histidine kinase [Jiulongibacter sediminis]|uniref:HAMP domain-containing sensor histidine kinase n=1 Tax=Jiulongibacter sediminis TaxID=1605367 RepID=UPI0026ED8D41|nr:HAMP domain-containing sensor histidine kinase [Jiulongibacter sediminis]